MMTISSQQPLNEVHTLFVDYKDLVKIIVEQKRSLDDYRRIGLQYKEYKINLSHIMYTTVKKELRGNRHIMRILVDDSTYDPKKSYLIDGIIKAAEAYRLGRDLSQGTMENVFNQILVFIYWLDNERISFPKNIAEAKQCFRAYKEYLQVFIKAGKNVTVIANKHARSLLLMEQVLNDTKNEIAEDISTINFVRRKANEYSYATKTQSELAYAFAFYYHFFDQVTDFLLEAKPYPYTITLPRGNAVLLPYPNSNVLASYEPPLRGNIAVSYYDGHILNDDDIESAISNLPDKNSIRAKKRAVYKRVRSELNEVLQEVNSVSNHPFRLALGNRAMDAWFMVMLAITGMNDSLQATLQWGKDDFTTTKESQEFRSIKARARNKPVTFPIRKAFIKSFEKFLLLRRFVLDRHECEYLYFTGFGENAKMTEAQRRGTSGARIFSSFSSLDSELPNVKSRDFRRDRGNDILKSKGLLAAIAALQNSKSVFLDRYSGETRDEKANQVHSFLQNIHETVTVKPATNELMNIAGGCTCEEELKPEPHSIELPIIPDCSDPKSCLFCIHYRTHPEKEEIRKLLSIEYIIKEISLPRAESQEHYNKAMKPWLDRIDALCIAMIGIDCKAEALIEELRHEVFYEGMLTPYWLNWMEMLEELEVFA